MRDPHPRPRWRDSVLVWYRDETFKELTHFSASGFLSVFSSSGRVLLWFNRGKHLVELKFKWQAKWRFDSDDDYGILWNNPPTPLLRSDFVGWLFKHEFWNFTRMSILQKRAVRTLAKLLWRELCRPALFKSLKLLKLPWCMYEIGRRRLSLNAIPYEVVI